MHSSSTHPSLLSRLRAPGDDAAWREFDERYHDLILRFCLQRGLQLTDAEDVHQTVLLQLSKGISGFCYDPIKGRFRDYLGTCVRHAIFEHFRRQQANVVSLDDSRAQFCGEPLAQDESAGTWEHEWVLHHYRLALSEVRRRSDAQSVAVFERLLAGASVADIGREFALEANAIYKIKQRMRERLEALIAQQIADEELPRSGRGP